MALKQHKNPNGGFYSEQHREVILAMDGSLYRKILYFSESAKPLECMWYHVLDKIQMDRFLIYKISDLFIPHQLVEPQKVEAGGHDITKMWQEIKESRKLTREELELLMNGPSVWAHSHVDLAVNPSLQDEEQWKLFKNTHKDKLIGMFIMNIKGEYFNRIYDPTEPVPTTWHNLPLYLQELEDLSYIDNAIVDKVKKAPPPPIVTPTYSSTKSLADYKATHTPNNHTVSYDWKKDTGTNVPPPPIKKKNTTTGVQNLRMQGFAPLTDLTITEPKVKDIWQNCIRELKRETHKQLGTDKERMTRILSCITNINTSNFNKNLSDPINKLIVSLKDTGLLASTAAVNHGYYFLSCFFNILKTTGSPIWNLSLSEKRRQETRKAISDSYNTKPSTESICREISVPYEELILFAIVIGYLIQEVDSASQNKDINETTLQVRLQNALNAWINLMWISENYQS